MLRNFGSLIVWVFFSTTLLQMKVTNKFAGGLRRRPRPSMFTIATAAYFAGRFVMGVRRAARGQRRGMLMLIPAGCGVVLRRTRLWSDGVLARPPPRVQVLEPSRQPVIFAARIKSDSVKPSTACVHV